MALVLEIAVAVFLILLGIKFWSNLKITKYKDFLAKIPGPKPVPFIGNGLDFKSTTALIPVFMNYMKTYGDIIQVWLGPNNFSIFISDHNMVKALLSSTQNINKGNDYDFLHDWLGQGLLTSKARRWRKHRKILTPAFHFQILEKFTEIFDGPTTILVRKMRERVGLSSVDIYPLISLNALDIICETSMGTSVDAQENENSEYVNAVKKISWVTTNKQFSVLKNFKFLLRFTRDYYRGKNALKILHGYTDSVIRKRKEEFKKMQENTNNEEQDCYARKKLALLDVLLSAKVDGKPINDTAIREEVDTFMFEGHDTTASGISFALHSLANHPDVQEKAYEEQRELFGDVKDPKITMNDLNEMKYLELVIKESLRLYPPVPIYGRQTSAAMEVDGQVYPKNLRMYAFVYGLHRNPKYFKNPDIFDPLRFKEMDSNNPFAYVPFSAGPRNCIGQKFATLEMKYVISSILRNFLLKPATPNEEMILSAELVLKSKNGIKISIYERN